MSDAYTSVVFPTMAICGILGLIMTLWILSRAHGKDDDENRP